MVLWKRCVKRLNCLYIRILQFCKPLLHKRDIMLNLDTSVEQQRTMSLMEPRISDLRNGFGGYGLNASMSGLAPNSVLPLWRPHPGTPVSWCTIPSCPCAMSISRSYLSLAELYDYPTYSSYSWSAWYLKAGNYTMFWDVSTLEKMMASCFNVQYFIWKMQWQRKPVTLLTKLPLNRTDTCL